MYDYEALIILNESKSAKNCEHYSVGKYDEVELEKTDYK